MVSMISLRPPPWKMAMGLKLNALRKSISNPLVFSGHSCLYRAKLDFAGILAALPLMGTCILIIKWVLIILAKIQMDTCI